MLNKLQEKNFFKLITRKNILVPMVLLFIVIFAIFFRFYHFNDWLYFKMDQSRDAALINKAIENGPGYLPLLGPRAGAVALKHGFLRLGPIFYYFQYISASIFQSGEPYVLAYPELFFSILTVILLYFFVRLYFSQKHSLMIVAMYAFSFIIIQYSRFSWNPNTLQFFLLLCFYGLLKFLNETDRKKKRWGIFFWALGITIGSQLHFFGFFSLVGISGLMFIFHYKLWQKKSLRELFSREFFKKTYAYFAIVFLVFTVFYTPVVLSDIRKNGENTRNFIEAMGSKAEKRPLSEKIVKDVKESAKYYCLITTSDCYQGSIKPFMLAVVFSAMIFLGGFILALRGLKKEQNQLRSDFLALLIVWVGVYTILTIPVAFQLRPRFYIVVFAVPFIFLGFIYEYLEEKFNKKYALLSALILTTIVIGWNLRGTYRWFAEQEKSQKEFTDVQRTLILKAKDGVTLGQLQGVTDWMYLKNKNGSNLYYYVKPEHIRPINFLLTEKHNKKLNFATMKLNDDPKAQFFAIVPSNGGIEDVKTKFNWKDITILDSKQFGQLTVSEIAFNGRVINNDFKYKKAGGGEDRFYWKDVPAILGF